MSEQHYSVYFCEDEGGWWTPQCVCGWKGGICPTAEDACDALMDHTLRAGGDSRSSLPVAPDGSVASNQESRPGS